MKLTWLVILTLVTLVCTYSAPCQWDQYLGNPGRTAHTHCRVPDSPEVLWEIILDGEADIPFIVGDRVVVCSQYYSSFPPSLEPSPPSNITVIDLLTGALLQEIVPDVSLVGAYPVGDKILVDSGGRLSMLDPSSGETSLVSEIPEKCACYPGCYPLFLPDKVILPTTPVVCLSRDDYSTQWNLKTSLGSLYPENGKPWNIAVSMDHVYVVLEGSSERTVLAVNGETGEFTWMREDILAWSLAAEGTAVYVGGVNVYALNAETGDTDWTFEVDSVRSNIAGGDTAVYFTDIQNYLYAVDKKTGELKWKTQWKETFQGITYIVQAVNTIICSNILNMSAFSAEDGTELWNVHFRDSPDFESVRHCPAVADGILVFARKEIQYEDSIVGIKPEILVALASDPDIFVKQGDAFLSKNMKEEAINSYRKAQELYKKKGKETQSQKIEDKILELENLQETTPPETTSPETEKPPETPPETPPESTPPPESTSTPILVLSFLVLLGVFIAYYFIRRKP